jgi:hypothetical protein
MYGSKLAVARHDGNLLEVDNSVFSSPWLTSLLGIWDKEEGFLGDSSPNVRQETIFVCAHQGTRDIDNVVFPIDVEPMFFEHGVR